MTRLHPKSEALMKRVVERFNDPIFMGKMKKRLVDEMADFFYNTPTPVLRKLLIDKMTKGALEHGKPDYTKNRIEKEKKEEMLDIMGWDFTGEDLDADS